MSRGMQSLNRSQGIYDFVMCGRETAHRWKKGWTHDWQEGVSSGSVPLEYTASTNTEEPGTALLLTWVLLCPVEGS